MKLRVDNVEMDDEAFLNLTGGMAAYFVSQPTRELVLESLDEALNYAPRLTKGFEQICLHFDANELAMGEWKLADAAEGLDWLLSAFHHCQALLGIGDEINDQGLAKLKGTLADVINRLGSQHDERQFSQMAITIRQELLPNVREFVTHVRRLRSFLTSTQ
jgi:hypothetical protein